MRRMSAVLAVCAALMQAPAIAESPSDPLSWLGRMATAGQRLNYSGTFIYQSGKNFETSRIAHMSDANGEHERLEVLDGSPREVIRSNNEVRCVLPDQKTVIIDRPGTRRAFPSRLPVAFGGLAENYRIRKGSVGRVAGLDAQQIILEPKDDLRFGYQLWAELQSGLLLKARTVDDRGEIVEQFTFSDVRIGGEIGSDAFRPRITKSSDWRIVQANGVEVRKEESGWALNAPLAGFSLVSVMRRPLGRDRGEALHMVYSDGLASISVFIEPNDGARVEPGPLASGAINIYKRVVGPYLVTALGEVPLRSVQRLGDAIEPVAR
ncbi:MAG: sigma-E factor negative regulatory protein RseB [Azoarcus sp.]|uniref:Sigma E regulatory protein, MucB/RseB n=1 Tax=Aromatoleum tolulyticum TaxID=34027 RepID=A0A1N7BJR8_9RHOO|nr:MucB/RseB C-terminal domain-containing protein [Aromatoleum tolulyticum]MCK9985034.1 sigma-E factor negative regulatory protein RseB [Azoarcus sp.]SIR51433.1 sigma E regulatory protein, MucB/RseB [Aromatoleum tolulyticum]